MKLTKSVIDRLPFAEKGQIYHWDSDFPGFGIRIGASAKSYVVERRVNASRDAREAGAFAAQADLTFCVPHPECRMPFGRNPHRLACR